MIGRIFAAAILFFTLTAQAHVPQDAVCRPSSSGISFGNFNATQITIIGTLSLSCTGNGNFSYVASLTTGASGNYSARRMQNGANLLAYNLYRDPAFALIWGDGGGGSFRVSGTVRMQGRPVQIVNLPIYARLPAQTRPAVGSYLDTITATVATRDSINTASFPVTANVTAGCAISATNLVFGSYTRAILDGQSQISIACNSGVAWNVGLNAGTGQGANVNNRKMSGPGNATLSYSLFRDATRSQNWGNTVGTNTVAGTGTGNLQTITVFGRIPASQSAATGGYQDTIVATITF